MEQNKYAKDFKNHLTTTSQQKLTIHYSFKLPALEQGVSFLYKINSLVPAAVIILSLLGTARKRLGKAALEEEAAT